MIAIAGGGISGLSTAYYLSQASRPCTLFEAQPRLGGFLQTERIEGCVVETGADSFLASKPWAADLIRELGLGDQLIGSNDSERKTYILKRGKLVRMPEGLQLIAPTRIGPILRTPLFSIPAKLRMAGEYFRWPVDRPDRSVSEFVADHFGPEAVEYLAEPLLAGVYGGDCAELSARSVLPKFVEFEKKYGSVTTGVLLERKRVDQNAPIFQTLKGGLGDLIAALTKAIKGKVAIVNRRVEAIERQSGGYRVRAGCDWFAAERVVLACGARRSGEIIVSMDASIAALLRSIPYSSSNVIALGFRRSEVRHPLNGFGFLVPKRERRTIMACTWVGTKFAHRVPPDFALLRCFVGGRSAASDDALIAAVLEDLARIMGIDAAPVFSRVFRWPDSMPQYTVGHGQRIAELESRLESWQGLHLTGNAYHGIGLPDCVREAKRVSERIVRGCTS
ncbi:MAG: protoporphyrinogen oxidase [Acidobacteriota bacterium]|nr:protoporphyrinogen oxidase [Acidobacteriota bacterium]